MQPEHDDVIVIRGGGDIATGVVWRLHHSGFRVVILELASPLTIRRSVSLSSAVTNGTQNVEGLVGRLCIDREGIEKCWQSNEIPVVVAPALCDLQITRPIAAVVDCRLAKTPLDTTISDANIVIGLGPGFIVGEHCHAVVETMRGHRLGRALFDGSAEPNTGSPGMIEGRSTERVIRASTHGDIKWSAALGDWVEQGDAFGTIHSASNTTVTAPFSGMIRGLILDGSTVSEGLKIADLDPRNDPSACSQISDKALAIGGGVVEAVCRLSKLK
ncbi:MAG: EF2563 family selenium-dependent molybdenum hydroxylase system protein [Actinobacteria bacterium]|nr:EF2563 family selenium-dependent molybdenum hydroxylase system protein [Actinomycetota bacterium]